MSVSQLTSEVRSFPLHMWLPTLYVNAIWRVSNNYGLSLTCSTWVTEERNPQRKNEQPKHLFLLKEYLQLLFSSSLCLCEWTACWKSKYISWCYHSVLPPSINLANMNASGHHCFVFTLQPNVPLQHNSTSLKYLPTKWSVAVEVVQWIKSLAIQAWGP